MSRRLAAALLLAMLAACSRQAARNEATPAPTPTAPATPAITSATGSAALPTPELDGVATAQGKWTFQISGNSAQAAFGIPGRRSLFALHCDVEGRRIVFTRAASGSAKSMQIVASRMGTIRGGFAYGQMPQIVAIQDVEPQPHVVIGVSPSMVVGREMALTPAVQARVSRIIF